MKRKCSFFLTVFAFMSLLLSLSSCYRQTPKMYISLSRDTVDRADTLEKIASRHYTVNSNFIIRSDSLVILRQQPEETISNLSTDSVVLMRHDHVVVADIRCMPNDTIDSVWVNIARDQGTFGWVHESEMLKSIVPDDPISQFIATFSDVHLLIFLVVLCLIIVGYTIRKLLRQKAHIVHFRDIDSFYPTLLALVVSAAATFYASIQKFAPDAWQDFYFNPTLNPFSAEPILMVFLISVWAILLIGMAVVDDVFKQLEFSDALLYLCGLAGVCAVDYIVFSVTTLYYLGYLLYAVYFVFAIVRYFKTDRSVFVCGNCGERLSAKGRCPKCGALNG